VRGKRLIRISLSKFIKAGFLVDPENPASRRSKESIIFKPGCPNGWIKRLIGYRDIEKAMPLKDHQRYFAHC
jgi:hypothetical protein